MTISSKYSPVIMLSVNVYVLSAVATKDRYIYLLSQIDISRAWNYKQL